jgi:hypothetical protein
MAAWDTGAFDNDGAMDWVNDLQAHGQAAVIGALRAAAEPGAETVTTDEGEEAVAAAEVVATAFGRPGPDLPDEVIAWIKANGPALPRDVIGLAQTAIERVLSGESELRELWVEDAENTAWPAAIEALRRRLAALLY